VHSVSRSQGWQDGLEVLQLNANKNTNVILPCVATAAIAIFTTTVRHVPAFEQKPLLRVHCGSLRTRDSKRSVVKALGPIHEATVAGGSNGDGRWCSIVCRTAREQLNTPSRGGHLNDCIRSGKHATLQITY
jgi:hypothetical protein